MAAVLACGAGTVLSHQSAGALWGIGAEPVGQIEVSVPAGSVNQRPGIRVHRRPRLWSEDLDVRNHVPVTSPVRTLIDLATQLDPGRLERSVNEADKLDLVDPDTLREALDTYRGQPGVVRLRKLLDRRTFRLTDSELERRFLPLVAAADCQYR